MKEKSKYSHLLKNYPQVISKEQFLTISRISKKTAKYLLDSGLVPCINTGKKTHKYKIRLMDAIKYLESRQLHPQAYKPPRGWYSNKTYNTKLIASKLTDEER